MNNIENILALAQAERDKHPIGADAHLGLSALCARIVLMLPNQPLRICEHTLRTGEYMEEGEYLECAKLEIRYDFPPELAGKRCRVTIELLEET